MKINCKIVSEDLLPLYADNTISDDGRKIVEDHIIECNNCKEKLENFKGENFSVKSSEETGYIEIIKRIRKKRIITTIIVVIIIIIPLTLLMYVSYPKYSGKHKWIREYNIGEAGIQGEFNKKILGSNSSYEVGADKYGIVVFKKPETAFKQMKKDYYIGLQALKKHYHLLSINKLNFSKYKNLSCQIPEFGNKEAKEQYYYICVFLDVYENSFS